MGQGGVMMLILTLLLASALAGLAIGPRYNIYMLVAASPVVGLVSAIATRISDFGFWEGSAIAFACITASQVAYLFVAMLRVDASLSGDQSDDDVGYNGQSKIGDNKHQQDPPRYSVK
jgi:hypothetical protein